MNYDDDGWRWRERLIGWIAGTIVTHLIVLPILRAVFHIPLPW